MRTLEEILEAAAGEDPAKAFAVAQALQHLPPKLKKQLQYFWPFNARRAQLKPAAYPWRDLPGPTEVEVKGVKVDRRTLNWFVWLILAGRGFGKTRAGAEYVRGEVEQAQRAGKPIRVALVAPTAADARDVMIEGDSGILGVSPPDNMPKYESSKRRLTWKDGSIATHFSAEEPERLRGPQHHIFWADELAAWAGVQATWDMLLFGLRLLRPGGQGPQGVITTTPKPVDTLVKIWKNPTTIVTAGSTHENKANLAPTFFDNVISTYEKTRLGRQEVSGELLLDVMGALWSAKLIDDHRVGPTQVPPLVRVETAVDPSISTAENAESGIVCGGLDARGHVYILEDASLQGSPTEWARKAIATNLRHRGDKVVGEANNGGEMVRSTLRMADAGGFANIKLVHASRGKITRAEPVSALYERGLVHHVGMFKKLEDQMVSYEPEKAGKMLVDRMDALVWLVTSLAVKDVQTAQRKGFYT